MVVWNSLLRITLRISPVLTQNSSSNPSLRTSRMVRIIFTASGFFCVGIGFLGVFLPVLPTTPLLLLALFCFSKGSERFHDWFKSTKLYQDHLDDFVTKRSMPLKTKLCICLPVSALLLTMAALSPNMHLRIFLVGLVVVKYWFFIFWIKTEPAESAQ